MVDPDKQLKRLVDLNERFVVMMEKRVAADAEADAGGGVADQRSFAEVLYVDLVKVDQATHPEEDLTEERAGEIAEYAINLAEVFARRWEKVHGR